jgi:hypothetical protein
LLLSVTVPESTNFKARNNRNRILPADDLSKHRDWGLTKQGLVRVNWKNGHECCLVVVPISGFLRPAVSMNSDEASSLRDYG